MSAANSFISSVVSRKDSSVFPKVTDALFSGVDLEVWREIKAHYAKYSEVPSEEAMMRTGIEYNYVKTNEAPAYYLDKLISSAKELRIRQATAEMVKHLPKDGIKDPDAALAAMYACAIESAALSGTQIFEDWHDTIEQRYKHYEEVKATEDGITGIPYPIEFLNKLTCGLSPCDFVGLFAQSGVGKTWMLCFLAAEMAKNGYNVMIITKEMPNEQIGRRLDSLITGIRYSGIKRGKLTPEEENTWRNTPRLPGSIYQIDASVDESGVSAVHSFIELYPVDVVMIDGYYMLSDEVGGKDDWAALKRICRGLKQVAIRTNCPIVVTGQLNEDGSLSGSKQIRTEFDLMIELTQTEDQRDDSVMTMRVMKYRDADGSGSLKEDILWDFKNGIFGKSMKEVDTFSDPVDDLYAKEAQIHSPQSFDEHGDEVL